MCRYATGYSGSDRYAEPSDIEDSEAIHGTDQGISNEEIHPPTALPPSRIMRSIPFWGLLALFAAALMVALFAADYVFVGLLGAVIVTMVVLARSSSRIN